MIKRVGFWFFLLFSQCCSALGTMESLQIMHKANIDWSRIHKACSVKLRLGMYRNFKYICLIELFDVIVTFKKYTHATILCNAISAS